MPFPKVTNEDRVKGLYPKWDGNSEFEKACLRYVGLPEDYHPTALEAWRIVNAAMED